MRDEQIQSIADSLHGAASSNATRSELTWERAETYATLGGGLSSFSLVFFTDGTHDDLEDLQVDQVQIQILEQFHYEDVDWNGYQITVLPDGSYTADIKSSSGWDDEYDEIFDKY